MIRFLFNTISSLFSTNTCLFISGGEKLPERLSHEEETLYIERYRNGDEKAKEKLIEHNLKLVVHIAKQFQNTKYSIEDLTSIGTFGLIKGVETYDPNKGPQLSNYIGRCITNEILMFIRKNKKTEKEISLDDPITSDSNPDTKLSLADLLGTEEDIVYKEIETNDERAELYRIIDSLNTKDKRIIVLRFGLYGQEPLKQKEVGELLGISQSYISRIERQVISKIKKSFSN